MENVNHIEYEKILEKCKIGLQHYVFFIGIVSTSFSCTLTWIIFCLYCINYSRTSLSQVINLKVIFFVSMIFNKKQIQEQEVS